MKKTREWGMVVELLDIIDELNDDQQRFVFDLYENLDPYAPFLSQQSEVQEDWLCKIYDFYCNENKDAFDDV